MPGSPIPRWLERAIGAAIDAYPKGGLESLATQSGITPDPLCIKYIHTEHATAYLSPNAQLLISRNRSFTWGTGTYVAPLAFPVSSAIFGRAGIVSAFDPDGWRVFDTTDPSNVDLYLLWLGRQRLARRAQVTMHTVLYNHRLRDTFRTHFEIDCILFHPDQHNYQYTDLHNDVWMNVTDWDGAKNIRTGWSDRLKDPKLTVLVEEEFKDDRGGRIYRELLGLTPRLPTHPPTIKEVADAYYSATILRIPA